MQKSTGFALVACLAAVLLTFPSLVSGSSPCGPGITTNLAGLPRELIPVASSQVTVADLPQAPLALPRHAVSGRPAADGELEQLDALDSHAIIPPGERAVFRLDSENLRLVEMLPEDNLTDEARSAVERAPDWLKDALADNLGRLKESLQREYAEIILAAEDPIVDEIAFQVARLGAETLSQSLMDPAIVELNARLIYEHDPHLQYVDLVDYGSAEEGGDYYTTTKYQVAVDGERQWIECPKEMYYWYVVEPKLSDEYVKKTSETDDRQATYGHFWREYLFSNPSDSFDYSKGPDGTPGHFPVLGDVLGQPQVFWDYTGGDLPKGRPFEEDDVALDVVGNWVSKILPEKAKGNRPVQPNQIAYEHDGNCGEIQDLLGAAARTGLIPTVLIADHCEDHVWNEFYATTEDADWHPYQVSWDGGPTHIDNPRIAMDSDCGGGKDISVVWAWRPDGYIYSAVERYSDVSTLVVHVKDGLGLPVDGARVLLASEAWQSEQLVIGSWCYTGSNGDCRFDVGDNQNYYYQVASELGNYPADSNQVARAIEDAEAGKLYETSVTLSGRLNWHKSNAVEVTGDALELRFSFTVPSEITYWPSLIGEKPTAAVWSDPGSVDVYLVPAEDYESYEAGEQFDTAVAEKKAASGEMAVGLPDADEDWYLIFTNENRLGVAEILDASIELHGDPEQLQNPVIYLPAVHNGLDEEM